MRDNDRLEKELRAGRLLRSSEDTLNVVDFGNAVASALGASGRSLTEGAETIAGLIGPTDHLVFVAADGFGAVTVESLDSDSFPRRHVAATLHTVIPSTTASAFTSMATGEWPSRHAAVGWYTYVPKVDAVTTIIPFVRSVDETPLAGLGLTVEEALPIPSLLGGIERSSLSFVPAEFAYSTFSAYLSGGTPTDRLRLPRRGRRRRSSQGADGHGAYLHLPVRAPRRHVGPRDGVLTSPDPGRGGGGRAGIGSPVGSRIGPRPDRHDRRPRRSRRPRRRYSHDQRFRPAHGVTGARAIRRQPGRLLPRPCGQGDRVPGGIPRPVWRSVPSDNGR